MNSSEPVPPPGENPESNRTSAGFAEAVAEPKLKRQRVKLWKILSGAVLLMAAAFICLPAYIPARTAAARNMCIANLKQMDGAIHSWALENRKKETDTVSTTEIVAFLKSWPTCPAGGTYSVSTVSAAPACSKSSLGHSI
ncbi:MAG: hypothetical protein HZA89_03755 [Verrucomicrobia bacterium]|nr:hypothetical protein [Verrucomicrobiota bacterium]